MPVVVTEPEPCAKQREVMESLGFTCHASASRQTHWRMTWKPGGNPLVATVPDFSLWLEKQWAPTMRDACLVIVTAAFKQGEAARAEAIAALLKA